MEFKLTKKERFFLQDAKIQEKVCIQKYENYAQQAKDPELKQLLNKHAYQEQHHYDSISLLLQGKKPDLGGNEESNSSEEQQSNTNQNKHSEYTSIKNNFEGTMENENEKVMCLDLFSTEKYISSTYDNDIFECANSEVREVLQHIQKEEQTHGEEILNYMNSHGMYKVK
ncbi:spore coat protein [Oceanirhabdus seepicola]|uniref:Spore coat protein n=1 Tax=Oceanirhabdus seepicola TaxID=2828781 RepID=A0A9J6P1P5_9CLOT|nr:spore coat protein [Oceanirhabdus seepicola]MCM1990698.1 spore coat protein [Oceanirhabdus seepicola]